MKMNAASSLSSRTLPSNSVTNPKEDLKGITTRSGTAYQGPTIPTTSYSSPKVVERETKVTKDTMPPTNNRRSKDVQPLVVQIETLILNSEPVEAPVVAPIVEPVVALNKLSFLELTPTLMTLKLADRSISQPIGVAEDVFVKVGKFHFLTDFVVVDFDADPRVPLIPGRSFIKTERALIDVYAGELTLRVNKEAEVDAFLALEDDPTLLEVDHSYYDTEGDILLLEAFLNDDPSLPPPNQGMYLPQVRKELKIYEAKNDKSLIDEPPEGELKDLPPHLEYVFLEGNDKFPVIIAKDLSVEEKVALIKVLKSHKQVIA
nr:reverse transcriptase domain-containing protein [Tanacetum cinerariifolium]